MPTRAVAPPDVLVWDKFVRVFHWGTVALVATAYLSPDEKALHEPVGYAVLGLVLARIGWGFVGTSHARFADFVVSPAGMIRYLKQVRAGRAARHLGHNPVGGAMILLLLTMLVIVAGSGWMSETDRWFGVPWVSSLHHLSAWLMLVFIGLHVAGAVASSVLHRENLVVAMISGRKAASLPHEAETADRHAS